MSDITLTASMRTNLLSLQNTQSLMDTTQERLSTGLKVNSAIDNPSAYYTAQSLSNRANDLSSLLDSMGQGIQTIQAANEGIESMTAFLEQAKAIVSSAADATDEDEVKNYAAQFDEIMDQIVSVAKDSNYKGINLLKNEKLTVKFNEKTGAEVSSLEIQTGKDFTQLASFDDTLAKVGANGGTWVTVAKTATETADTYVKGTLDADKVYKDADGSFYKASSGDVLSKDTLAEAIAAGEVTKMTDAEAQTAGYADTPAGVNKANIETTLNAVSGAISTLRDTSSALGNNYSIVENRQDFTENLINVLTEGADKLTLADMNEESANMLALQTRQQLAINSLSLASQAAQSVLKLF